MKHEMEPFKEERVISPVNVDFEEGNDLLTEFKNNKNWIIREREAGSVKLQGEDFKPEIAGMEAFAEIKKLFAEFENKYRIAITPSHLILGHGKDNESTFFVVSKKIEGTGLREALGNLPNDVELQKKFAAFLKSLITYFFDKYKTNEFALSDVGAIFQYIYGTPIDDPDKPKQIFLIDTHLEGARGRSAYGEVADLTEELEKLEKALKKKSSEIRSIIAQLVNELEKNGKEGYILDTLKEYLEN